MTRWRVTLKRPGGINKTVILEDCLGEREAIETAEAMYGLKATGPAQWLGPKPQSSNTSSFNKGFTTNDTTFDTAFAVAGGALALGAKGLWKLGKFGVRKYQENKEEKVQQERSLVELGISKFLENPRIFNVTWEFASTKESFTLDGRQTLSFLQTPNIISRYIDDALDDLEGSPETISAWKTMLKTCERIKHEVVTKFPYNLSVLTTENSSILSSSSVSAKDILTTNLLLLRLLSRDGDSIGPDAMKLHNRLNKSLTSLKSISSDSIWNSIELPLTPLTSEYFEEQCNEQSEDPDSTSSSEYWENDLDDDISSSLDQVDIHDSKVESESGTGSFYSGSSAQIQDIVTCETSTYGCIWYEREGFSLNPNPEGTLVISEKKIFFIEVDMDISGILAILNNDVDEDGAVRWIFSPDAVSSITKSKVSFRSAYTINTKSGGSYKMVFMPGKGESVIAKLRQLGIKTSF
jgi:hypothetical protein